MSNEKHCFVRILTFLSRPGIVIKKKWSGKRPGNQVVNCAGKRKWSCSIGKLNLCEQNGHHGNKLSESESEYQDQLTSISEPKCINFVVSIFAKLWYKIEDHQVVASWEDKHFFSFILDKVLAINNKRNRLKIKGIKVYQLKAINHKFWEYQKQNI